MLGAIAQTISVLETHREGNYTQTALKEICSQEKTWQACMIHLI